MTEPIKVGFIGGGPRARGLLRSLCFNEINEDRVEPKAVFDLNPDALKEWQYMVENQYSSFDGFLKEELDAIIIATPPNTHASLAKKCLEVGLDVWSEVPMGLSMEELWSVIDADKSNKGTRGHFSLGENYCYMLQPQFMAMKNREGKLGNIFYCEGEYTHSVEHYMIMENYLLSNQEKHKEVDPELADKVTPTWRADYKPIKYGHALGPCLYMLNSNQKGIIERPTQVSCMGNMKMQKRFNTDNFQIATVQTDQDTIIKFVIGFVLGHHGRVFYSAWGSAGIFNGGSFQTKNHHYVEIPPEKRNYPARLDVEARILTDEDLKKMGTPHATGGHGGGDTVMFEKWIDSLYQGTKLDIDVFRSAEMTAPGILAVEAEIQKKYVDIPIFK